MSIKFASSIFTLLLVVSLLLTESRSAVSDSHSPAAGLPGHSATPLLDGRVLVAGGDGASVRVYPPGSLHAQSIAPMAGSRRLHTATLLLTGEVLVAGGLDENNTATTAAERFDPTTNQWRTVAPMNAARASHTATRLSDGSILVIGGIDANGAAIDRAKRYNPLLDRWDEVTPLPAVRTSHTATLLPDGRVAAIGGRNVSGVFSNIELFDPTTNTWTSAAFDLQTPRYDHTATLYNGQIVIIGGKNRFTEPLASVEVVSIADGASAAPSLAEARSLHSATLRPDGSLLVAGGVGLETLASVEVLSPGAANWTPLASLSTPRSQHTATLLPGGAILIVDGNGAGVDAEIILASTGGWQTHARLSIARAGHTATLLPDGSVLVAGGVVATDVLTSSERFDPLSNTWQASAALRQPRFGHSATLLPNGHVLVTGGEANGAALRTAERFAAAADVWQPAASMQFARRGHSATLLADGDVLVVGGDTTPGNRSPHPLALQVGVTAERYDPAADHWKGVAAPLAPRVDHTATLLPDGRVLVVGGNGAGLTAATAAERYDPIADQWGSAGAMTRLRRGHTATLLPGGRVLVAGGVDPTDENFTVLDSAELFDSTANTWSNAAPMPVPRHNHRAVLLPSGEVLLVGGENRDGLVASAALYDPASDRWRTLPLRDAGRILHTATLLLDGRILIAGGLQTFAATDSALTYTPLTAAARPVLDAALINEQREVVMTGAGFRPINSASSDDTRQSATNAPLVQLRHLDSERLHFPGQTTGTIFSTTAITGTALVNGTALLTGPTIATVFVNGAASDARFVTRTTPPQLEGARLYLPMIVR
ncbi:MAG: kelch repeat-containing protein [Caldilinea sp.]